MTSGYPDPSQSLRQRAEAIIEEEAARPIDSLECIPPENMQQVLHDLRVHQIELEMQNEELRRVVAELGAARARYFTFYDLAPVGYVSISEQGLIVEANLTTANQLGVPRGVLLKQPLNRFILREDQDVFYLHRKKLLETDVLQRCELRVVKHDGTACWMHLVGTASQNTEGRQVLHYVLHDISDHKLTEEALRVSEAHLHAVMENAPFLIWLKDTQGRYLFANQNWINTTQFSSMEDIRGKTDFDLWPQALAKQFRVDDAAVLAAKNQINTEELAIDMGQEAWFETFKAPVIDLAGNVIGTTGFSHNISLRKQSDEMLRTLFTAVEQSPASVIITDLAATIQYVNPQFTTRTGYDATEVIGQNPRIFQSGQTAKETHQDMWGTLTRGQSWHGELLNKHKNGALCWEEVHIAPVRDKSGSATHYVAIRVDISERMLIQAQLAESQQRWKFALEGAGDGVWDWDIAAGTMTFSKRWYEIQGFDEGSVGPAVKDWRELVHPEDLPLAEMALLEHFAGKTSNFSCEHRVRCKNGQFKWILGRGMVITRDPEGQPLRAIGTHSDITDRRLAAVQLSEMATTLENLVNKRTRQLRRVSAQLTLTEERERRMLAQELHDNLGQLLAVIRIKLTSPDSGLLQPSIAQILDLLHQAEQSARMITQQLSPPVLRTLGLMPALGWLAEDIEHNYSLQVHIDDNGQMKPLSDEIQSLLYRSVRELLINVAKHAGVKDASICHFSDEHQLRLLVSDHGCGFDSARLLATRAGQHGFGLNSILERISNIGGQMTIDSNPDYGTTVTLRFPYASAATADLPS